MEFICTSLDLFGAAVIMVLLIGALLKVEHPKPFGKRIILLLLGHILGLLCDSMLWIWNPELFPTIPISIAVAAQKVGVFVAYGALVGMTFIYTDCIVKYIEEKEKVPKWIVPCVTIVCVIAAVLWTASIFNGMFFFFDENGMFVATGRYWITQNIIALMLCVNVFLILKHHKAIGWRNALPLLSYILLPILGFSLSYWWDVAPVYIAATLSILWMFIVFHLEQDKQLRKQERELVQSHISTMLGQIQPHFLYNTLTAICGLCDEDPKEAQRMTANFSDYLRHNLASLNQRDPIPFEHEMLHTQSYLEIEQTRFGERLSIIYDIQTTDFKLPSLTIQPIAENAVKHGVTKRKSGGIVTISTQAREDCYEIIIADNGVGFDTEKQKECPEAHIGIENVRNRLWSIIHGTLTITSEMGIGTVATIRIPKGGIAFLNSRHFSDI